MSEKEVGAIPVRCVHALHELAREVEPTRDLWPGIASAIATDRVASVAAPARRNAWRVGFGLAASVALIAVGMLLGRSMPSDRAALSAASASPGAATEIVPVIAPDARHAATRERLLRDAEANLAELPTQDRERVAASLAAIRRSVQEIEAAIGREPANALLQELLVNAYQDEMRVLTALSAAHQEI